MREYVRGMLDTSITAESMLVMSLLSDAQELIAMGEPRRAIDLLNVAKVAIDMSLGERDEHGRHETTGKRYE